MKAAPAKGYPNLELLRFAAALAVVVYHYQHFKSAPGWRYKHVVDDQPFAPALHLLYAHGHMAVQFFWMLSGFIFFSQYLDRIATGRVGAWRFAVLRFSRLYPLHIATALFVFAVQFGYRVVSPLHEWFIYQSNSGKDLFLHLFMASQWHTSRTFTLNGPVWSVSLEILAYASFFPIARWVRKPALVTACAPGLLLYATVADAVLTTTIACFYLGGGVWQVQRWAKSTTRRTAAVTAISLASAAVLIASQGHVLLHERWGTPAFNLAMYAAFAMVILAFATLPQITGRMQQSADTLGNLTYGSYLLHFPLQLTAATIAAALGRGLPWRSPVLLVGYVAVVGVAALASYRHFELPAQQWLRDNRRSKQEVAP